MWWMQVGMDTLQKLQLLGNKRQKVVRKIRCLFIPMQRLGIIQFETSILKMVGYQVPGIWYMYERYGYHEYLDKYRSHIENYEDLQRKIHGEMITNSLDSWNLWVSKKASSQPMSSRIDQQKRWSNQDLMKYDETWNSHHREYIKTLEAGRDFSAVDLTKDSAQKVR